MYGNLEFVCSPKYLGVARSLNVNCSLKILIFLFMGYILRFFPRSNTITTDSVILYATKGFFLKYFQEEREVKTFSVDQIPASFPWVSSQAQETQVRL